MEAEIKAQADFKKCGAGQGAECCIFLISGTDGAECARFGGLHSILVSRTDMTARRQPAQEFPECQLEACHD